MPRTDTLTRQEARLAYRLISPTLLIVVVVVVLPVVWTISLAFQDVRLINLRDAGFFGEYNVDNFTTVFGSSGFWSSLWTTVIYTVGATLGSIVIGLIAALALRKPFRGRGVLRAAMLLPYVAPVVAATFVWTVALNPQFGIVNAWGTRFLGWDEPVPFLSQRDYAVGLFGVDVTVPLALLTVIAFEAWRYFPFAFLFIIARLQALPGELDEAAVVDGTSIWQRFRYITLPQLMPVIALLTILRFILTFNKFDDIYLLTGGGAGTEVVSIRVYEFLTARTDIGAAAAQSLVLAGVLTVFIAIYMRTAAGRGETS
ncbi:ABC transporter permease subunit [Jiangella mangrovi]|uniref:Multiple sugar transport system permease protein n=1 Tax=Jiangella mangrovi TaxID=1524084 RepID=A0A7W9LK54_9ACTN|nr:multiple sugar transport system permease protein [Jiangella mangrovi]